MLPTCCVITIGLLKSSGNHFGSAAGVIADALLTNTTLRSLNMYADNMGPEAGAHFANLLEKNTTIRSVNLYGNNIGESVGNRLAQLQRADKDRNIKF
eukprot:m.217898 g.217898  ORF g.217898 m.217898 type:complete len:98 (-) comp26251_c1_seq25:356-649(-)